MYAKYGFDHTIKALDGVFAICLIDLDKNKIFLGRDPIGVRSLFTAKADDGSTVLASEMKQIHGLASGISQFKPGCWMELGENVMH